MKVVLFYFIFLVERLIRFVKLYWRGWGWGGGAPKVRLGIISVLVLKKKHIGV